MPIPTAGDLEKIDTALANLTKPVRTYTLETSLGRFADAFEAAVRQTSLNYSIVDVLTAENGQRQRLVRQAQAISEVARQQAADTGRVDDDELLDVDDAICDLMTVRKANAEGDGRWDLLARPLTDCVEEVLSTRSDTPDVAEVDE